MAGTRATSQVLGELDYFVDLDRYPIHDLDSTRGRQLIADAHDMMARDTLCLLPGFLRPDAVRVLQDELNALASDAHQIDFECTAYSWTYNDGFPDDHPRGALFRRNCGVITTDQVPANGPNWTLYLRDELVELVRRMLRYETLYRSACPTLAVQVNIMAEGDTFGWHFDTNDGVISIMIQEADDGGGFEYVPLIRDEDDENFPGVKRVVNGEDKPKCPPQPAGTFALFLGRRSVHRVAHVGKTSKPRLSLLLSYDRKPDQFFGPKICQRFLNPSPEPYRGLPEPAG